MAAKGGLFLPMYQREAMWINFNSHKPYAIKAFVGGVNIVSGEPAIETAATRLRRRTLLSQNKSIQDYLVVPDQPWIDGIATSAGRVRQFVAMSMGTGCSVEAQMTGEEVTGGIQFEITPCELTRLQITVAIGGQKLDLNVPENGRFSDLINRLEMEGGIQWTGEYRIYHDKNHQLEELTGPPSWMSPLDPLYGRDLRDLGIQKGSHLVVRRNGELENRDRAMKIKIKIKISSKLTGTEFDVLASPDDTVDDFKLLIQKQEGIAPYSQILTHIQKRINGYGKLGLARLGTLGIGHGSVVFLQIQEGVGYSITVKTLKGKAIVVGIEPSDTVFDLKLKIQDLEGIQLDQQRFLFDGKQLEDERLISDYSIRNLQHVYLILRIRGGGDARPKLDRDKGVAVGGFINQAVVRDPGTHNWITMQTKLFNVQILNTLNFQRVTGFPPPEPSIDAETYARYGYPFFGIYEEPTTVAGDFSTLKSVGQIDGKADPGLGPHRVIDLTHRASEPRMTSATKVGLLSPNRPLSEFKSVEELEKELRGQGQTVF